MRISILILLVSSFLFSKSFLENYDCDSQNYDFWYEVTLAIEVDFKGDETEKKRILGSYYKSSETNNCRVDYKKWCFAYKDFVERDYKIYRPLWYFKCYNFNNKILKDKR